ncbi:DNA cytosine methyltransferase [Cobetia crustatorum]|uniref:DNA (cytosine-5-)-methyltransferase n=1 Tax=Cobetia crustatorum TaxID=553385 RepID=A0A558HRV7_9GAMM|nr:DNA cytosine methyltransferase [Cobetia crustatorum]TVU71872.1 DNA cytosine methyltransferase [Cobetia crustatorum]
MNHSIQVVDLFAGPGGLGEGFNSLRDDTDKRVFKTLVSVEKEASAHKTLTLRAFFRELLDSGKDRSVYFDYLMGGPHPSSFEEYRDLWAHAEHEALSLELGGEAGNHALEERLEQGLDHSRNWVLIGGPPCQAYSLAGRSRNKGNKEYKAEDDKRHFLYKEYLSVIARHRPAVFIMENVRGILSSKVNGEYIFDQILADLNQPDTAVDTSIVDSVAQEQKKGYTIFSLVDRKVHYPRENSGLFGATPLARGEFSSFLIKAEQYGIPQARHRVILAGVRDDLVENMGIEKIASMLQVPLHSGGEPVSAAEVLCHSGMPVLRSGLSRDDSRDDWSSTLHEAAEKIIAELRDKPPIKLDSRQAKELLEELKLVSRHAAKGLRLDRKQMLQEGAYKSTGSNSVLEKWLQGAYSRKDMPIWVNHETRGHIKEDLARYLYCSAYAKITGKAPKGSEEIHLDCLAPNHANWKSGNFSDRFRVVVENAPSKTITSHISKDGHYYIHPDPFQCRSLTVREAARLQTFPDDYLFEGNRTQQYVQVGNAVPPLLAKQIAERVLDVLKLSSTS